MSPRFGADEDTGRHALWRPSYVPAGGARRQRRRLSSAPAGFFQIVLFQVVPAISRSTSWRRRLRFCLPPAVSQASADGDERAATAGELEASNACRISAVEMALLLGQGRRVPFRKAEMRSVERPLVVGGIERLVSACARCTLDVFQYVAAQRAFGETGKRLRSSSRPVPLFMNCLRKAS